MAENSGQPIKWEASEYVHHDKSPIWYVAYVLFFTALLGGIYFIVKDIISVVVIGLLAVAALVLSTRKPRTLSYELTGSGIVINGKEFPYASFKSFSIMQSDALENIFLEPLERYMPPISVYVAPDQIDAVASIIGQYLPNRMRDPDLIDRFIHRIRL